MWVCVCVCIQFDNWQVSIPHSKNHPTLVVSLQGSQASTSLLLMLWPHCCILLSAPLLRAPLGCCPRNLVLEKVGAQINALIDMLCWKIRNNLPPRLTSKVMGYESPNDPSQRPVHIMYRKRICSVTKRPPDNGVLAPLRSWTACQLAYLLSSSHSTPANKCIGWWRNKESRYRRKIAGWLVKEQGQPPHQSLAGRWALQLGPANLCACLQP
jgi:hypothetical protein